MTPALLQTLGVADDLRLSGEGPGGGIEYGVDLMRDLVQRRPRASVAVLFAGMLGFWGVPGTADVPRTASHLIVQSAAHRLLAVPVVPGSGAFGEDRTGWPGPIHPRFNVNRR